MLRIVFVAALSCFLTQAQVPPPTPPSSPFAAAAIKREGAANGTPVKLTFAWPTGMIAAITAERSRLRVTPAGRDSGTSSMKYRMKVTAHPDGRLIEYDNFEPLGVAPGSADHTAVADVVSSLVPSLIVSPDGRFVRAGDLSTVRAAVRQIVDAAKTRAPDGAIPANLVALVDGLSTTEVLTRIAADEWQTFAGAFAGFEGIVGQMSESSSEEPSPIVAGLLIPMRTTFGALRTAPCEPGHTTHDCVVMQMRSVVAPGAMQIIAKRLFEGMKGAAGVTYDRFDATTEVESTLEPSTMRPYLVTLTKTVNISVTVAGQGSSAASMTDRRTYRITYAKR
jgi:hypothetical protein